MSIFYIHTFVYITILMFVGLLPIFMFLRVLIILHQPHPLSPSGFQERGRGDWVRLTNFNALRSKNLSLTNKTTKYETTNVKIFTVVHLEYNSKRKKSTQVIKQVV